MIVPDGDTWTFTYTPQPNDPDYGTQYNYGELTRVDLPTGGSIRYDWYTVGASCANTGSQPTIERRAVGAKDLSVDGQTWNSWIYSIPLNSANLYTGNYQATVTDPLGNYEVHNLTNEGYCSYFDTRVDHFTKGGTLLRTDETSFQALPLFAYIAAGFNSGIGALPTSALTIWPDGSTKGSSFSYDAGFAVTDINGNSTTTPYGLQTQKLDYNYGSGADGALLRTTTRQYWWQTDTTDPVLAYNILHPVSSLTILDNTSNLTRQITYAYDKLALSSGNATAGWDSAPPNGNTRGNQTEIYVQDVSDALTLETDTSYTNTGMVASVTPPADARISPATTTTYQYSSQYQGALLTSKTNALGQTTQYTYYPSLDLVHTVIDPNNTTTTYSYLPDTRLYSVIYPVTQTGQPQTSYSYPSPNQVQKSVQMNATSSIVTASLYDGLGRQSSVQVLGGCASNPTDYTQTDTTYDGAGNVYQVTNPHCHSSTAISDGVTTYAPSSGGSGYDGLGRLLVLTHPDGSTQRWTYNDETVTFTDESSNVWSRTTNALGQLAQVVEPGNLSTTYVHNAFGDLTTITQTGNSAAGEVAHIRTFTYNGLSQLVTSTNPETGTICYGLIGGVPSGAAPAIAIGGATPYLQPTPLPPTPTPSPSPSKTCVAEYDHHGNVLYKTNAKGIAVSYAYDSLDRLTQKSASDGSVRYTYTYDQGSHGYGVGRLTTSSNNVNGGASYTYDALGHVVSRMVCLPTNCTYNLGSAGTYDLAGNLVTSQLATGAIVYTTFDGSGRLSGSSYATSGTSATENLISNVQNGPIGPILGLLGNGSSEQTGYDNRMRLGSYSVGVGGVSRYSYSLQYTPNSNVQSATDSVNGSWTYGYDGLNRLKTAQGPGIGVGWTYDSFGDRLAQSAISGNPPVAAYTYNSNNNRADQFCYDLAGNMLNTVTCSQATVNDFGYDGEDKLISSSFGTETYVYDADGHRIAKQSSGTTTNEYLYDVAGNMTVETDGNGNVLREEFYAGTKHLGTIQGAPTGSVYYAHTNWLGTETARTNSAGAVCFTATSLPFGDNLQTSGSCNPSYKFFTGKERDTESGLDYFGARYYASSMGRWTSPDWAAKPEAVPYSSLDNPQSLNLYEYVGNNPLSRADADGHQWPQWLKSVAAGAAKYIYNSAATSPLATPAMRESMGAADITGRMSLPQPSNTAEAVGYYGTPVVAAAAAVVLPEFGGSVNVTAAAAAPMETEGATLSSLIPEAGQDVYRVWGGDSGPNGHSWSPMNPDSASNYRDAAGLPNVNTGTQMTTGTLTDATGVTSRPALPLDGNKGGAPEYLVPNPQEQIQIRSIKDNTNNPH